MGVFDAGVALSYGGTGRLMANSFEWQMHWYGVYLQMALKYAILPAGNGLRYRISRNQPHTLGK